MIVVTKRMSSGYSPRVYTTGDTSHTAWFGSNSTACAIAPSGLYAIVGTTRRLFVDAAADVLDEDACDG